MTPLPRHSAETPSRQDVSVTVRDIDRIVTYIRTGMYGTAASCLNAFLSRMQHTFSQEEHSPAVRKKLAYSLETVFLMLQQSDWVAVADILEHECKALLRSHDTHT